MGHATNLVGNQKAAVKFVFHTLPIFGGLKAIAERTSFRLFEGYSAETSGPYSSCRRSPRGRVASDQGLVCLIMAVGAVGGLLVALPANCAQAFCDQVAAESGHPAWIVGTVEAGT